MYRFVRLRIVRKDYHYQLSSSMNADPLASPDGSQHGDQPQHGVLPGFTGYSPFIQQPTEASMPGNTNGNDASNVSGFNVPGNYRSASPTQATFRDATNMVAQGQYRGPIKVQANEVWPGEPNSLYDFIFTWSVTLQSHGLRMASDMLADPARGLMLMNLATQQLQHTPFVESIFRENAALFAFMMERISTKTTRGNNLRAELADGCEEGTIAINNGFALAQFIRESVQYKTMEEVEDVRDKMESFRFELKMDDETIKMACTAVRRNYFRMPTSCRGPALQPFSLLLAALPAECKVEKALMMNELGLSGFRTLSINTEALVTPPWPSFSRAIQSCMRTARGRGGISPSSAGLPSTPVVDKPEALVNQAKTDAPGGKPERKMKCWHCGDEHAASKCTKDPCAKCGKRYCGALRGLSCMITDGIPEGARGVDGKPLDARVVENIKKASENKKSGGPSSQAGGAQSLVTEHTAFNESSGADPLDQDDGTSVLDQLMATSLCTELLPVDPLHCGTTLDAPAPLCLATGMPGFEQVPTERYLTFVIDGESDVDVIRDVHLFGENEFTRTEHQPVGGLAPGEGTVKSVGTITATLCFAAPDGTAVPHRMRNALAVPDAKYNLLSEGALWDSCRGLVKKGDVMVMILPSGTASIERDPSNRMYTITAGIPRTVDPVSLVTNCHDSQRNALVWHSRMVLTPDSLRTVSKLNTGMHGISEGGIELIGNCEIEARSIDDYYMRDLSQTRKSDGPSPTPKNRRATN